MLVDTSAARLCLPAGIIKELSLTFQVEIDAKTAAEIRKVRVFRDVNISVEGREGRYDCVELLRSEAPLLGLISLDDLELELD